MAFIRIVNEFFNTNMIVSAKLTQVVATIKEGEFERTTEFSVFTLYGVDGKVIGKFGGPDVKQADTVAGLRASNEFAAQTTLAPQP